MVQPLLPSPIVPWVVSWWSGFRNVGLGPGKIKMTFLFRGDGFMSSHYLIVKGERLVYKWYAVFLVT